jgi:hypothetical protein
VTEDQDTPPSREGLSDAQVWEWADDHWQIREIAPFEQTNVGGSPEPVEEP